jgi:probable HAF family extracellular repeat protein
MFQVCRPRLLSFSLVVLFTGCADLRDPVSIGAEEHPLESRSGKLVPIDLGTLGGDHAVAMDINNKGEVVGYSTLASGERRAFRWTVQGGMQELGTLGGSESGALAINNDGVIVGWSDAGPTGTNAFVWTQEDGMRLLPHVDDPDLSVSHATDINDHGQIVGFSGFWVATWDAATLTGVDGPCAGGFLLGINNNGDIVGVESKFVVELPSGTSEYTGIIISVAGGVACEHHISGAVINMVANDINDDGVLVGAGAGFIEIEEGYFRLVEEVRPQLWFGGEPTFLSHSAGSALAINERGDVAGYFGGFAFGDNLGATSAFLWDKNRGFVNLPLPGAARSSAVGINNRGDVVGWIINASGARRAILWAGPGRFSKPAQGVVLSRAADPAVTLSPVAPMEFEVTQPCPPQLRWMVEVGASNACGARRR